MSFLKDIPMTLKVLAAIIDEKPKNLAQISKECQTTMTHATSVMNQLEHAKLVTRCKIGDSTITRHLYHFRYNPKGWNYVKDSLINGGGK